MQMGNQCRSNLGCVAEQQALASAKAAFLNAAAFKTAQRRTGTSLVKEFSLVVETQIRQSAGHRSSSANGVTVWLRASSENPNRGIRPGSAGRESTSPAAQGGKSFQYSQRCSQHRC